MKKVLLTIFIILQSAGIAGIGIGYSETGPLPVELTSFTGKITNNSIELNWETATEVDNYGFEIERASAKGIHSETPLSITVTPNEREGWETLGFVPGHGNSNSPKEYSFIDYNPKNGTLHYRLKQIDSDGTISYSEIVEISFKKSLPNKFELSQNYPNPFNPSTKIKFGIPDVSLNGEAAHNSHVQLRIFDILGREITVLINENLVPGYYEVEWNASGFSSGMYFYQVVWNGKSEVKKLMLTK